MSALDRSRTPTSGSIRKFDFPDVERRTLSNGLDLRVCKLSRLPVVSTNLFFRAGEGQLVESRAGLAVLTGDALTTASCIELGKPLLVFWNEEQAAQSVQKILSSARIFYPGHDRPFKLDEKDNVEYIGGDKDLRIFQGLGFGNGEVSVTISPEPPRNTVVAG